MIEEGTVTPGAIEFTMQIGGGETAAALNRSVTSGEAVSAELLSYVNGALGLMVPAEMLSRTWFVERMDYHRGRQPRVRVWLTTLKLS